ncbi:uncharacterized protein LOC117790287 isoform X2 [Drosophila innubila]|uniref:uncharacterized protein LOC117790287 isoform X2 n=1 Tax=Drosophila innubila TaxID=198719 RepID=UPI00148B7660|nr:uncharacterized protein LOC117790287 isoform X2 [Drosophila innubila]
MTNMTLQQVLELRKAQEDLNTSKSLYLEFYRKMAKHAYRTDLENLISGDFNVVFDELHVLNLPPQYTTQDEYTSMLQMAELYEMNKSWL